MVGRTSELGDSVNSGGARLPFTLRTVDRTNASSLVTRESKPARTALVGAVTMSLVRRTHAIAALLSEAASLVGGTCVPFRQK